MDVFENHGVPVCLDGKLTVFSGTDPETFIKVELAPDTSADDIRVMSKAVHLFAPLARAMGVPWLHFPDRADWSYPHELMHAGGRATVAQAWRAERVRENEAARIQSITGRYPY